MLEVRDLLRGAVSEYLPRLSAFSIGGLLLEGARQNERRPAWLKVAVPDACVKNLWGKPKLRDVYLVLRIPLEVAQKLDGGSISGQEVCYDQSGTRSSDHFGFDSGREGGDAGLGAVGATGAPV